MCSFPMPRAGPALPNLCPQSFAEDDAVDEQGISVADPQDLAVPPPGPARAGGGGLKLRIGLLALALAGGAGAYFFLRGGTGSAGGRDGGESATGHGGAPRLPVEIVHPRPGGVERSTTQAGSVHAFEHAALYSKVSGYLKVQGVDIGDRVTLGQLLAVIDAPEVDKAVEQSRASLDQARAKARVAEVKIRSALAAQ